MAQRTNSPTSTVIDVNDDRTSQSPRRDDSKVVEKSAVDPFEVKFHEGDPANPKNWSNLRRWYLTMVGGLLLLNATFASSSPSGIVPQLMQRFSMSGELGTLTISLFLAGYCVGPLLWGPLSEQFGRRPIFIVAFFVYTCFQVGCALSRNTASILIFRFLGGTFAAAPLTNSGALISDIWDAKTRGKALAIFALAPFAGPALGPIVSGYIAVAGLSWRWVFWILTIFAGVCWIQIILTVPETYAPVILATKAAELRKETGDKRYFAPLEREHIGFAKRVETVLARPFKILFHEPMLIVMTVYMSFIYGCVYLLFEAYPIIFSEGHHFNAGASGLMFLPIPLGCLIAVIGYLLYFNPRYEGAAERYAPNPVPPEFRLEIVMLASPFFAISFFWIAWTSFPTISFWAPMMASLLMGWSICCIFLGLLNYIIDAYLFVAASALASNTVIRSLSGAAFPLFATQMFNALGPRWASSLVGFVAVAMIPIPFVLMKFGPRLRLHSKYAPTKNIGMPASQPDAESPEAAVEKESERSTA